MNHSLRYRINAPHVVHEIFEDREAALINLKNGNYYSLDAVGAYTWSLIDAGATLGEIVEDLMARYDASMVVLIDEVSRFIEALGAEQLIVPAQEGTAVAPRRPRANDGHARVPFSPPVLERYNDMQELLLLDPIHEADETGWPRKQE